jgi:transcription antitermination factor NusG
MALADERSELGYAEDEQDNAALDVKHWYAVQVASGCEKKVKQNLEQRLQTLDVADRILQIEIPQAPIVKLRKDGSRQTGEEKVFPGYVLVRMIMAGGEKHPQRHQLCGRRADAAVRQRQRSRQTHAARTIGNRTDFPNHEGTGTRDQD